MHPRVLLWIYLCSYIICNISSPYSNSETINSETCQPGESISVYWKYIITLQCKCSTTTHYTTLHITYTYRHRHIHYMTNRPDQLPFPFLFPQKWDFGKWEEWLIFSPHSGCLVFPGTLVLCIRANCLSKALQVLFLFPKTPSFLSGPNKYWEVTKQTQRTINYYYLTYLQK